MCPFAGYSLSHTVQIRANLKADRFRFRSPSDREHFMALELPTFIPLLTIAIQAGCQTDEALRLISFEAREQCPCLCDMFAALIDEIKITGLSFEKKMGQLQQETNSTHLFDFFGALAHANQSDGDAIPIFSVLATTVNEHLQFAILDLKRDSARRWFPHFLFCFFCVVPLVFMNYFLSTRISELSWQEGRMTSFGDSPEHVRRHNSYSFHLGYSQQPTLEHSLYFEPAVVAKRY